MPTPVKPIPDDSSILIPRLFCRDPAAEMDFIAAAFAPAVRELNRRPGPDAGVAHGLLTIGPAMLMIERQWPSLPSQPPPPDGSSAVVLFVYVENVDQTVDRAVAAGAKVLVPAANQFWGDRTAWIIDPAGHVWTIATRIEEPTEQERQARLSCIYSTSTGDKK